MQCLDFEDSYEQVSLRLGRAATVARVDGALHRVLALRFHVRGFPSFFLVWQGRVYDFTGPRTVDGLVEFVETRGADRELGRPHPYFFGPLAPYWRIASALLKATAKVSSAFHRAKLTTPAILGVALGSLMALLTIFLALIYILTKPPALAKPQARPPRHQHVD